ncbi:Sodium-coupled monocarboxylate transporter 2 [Orchesella cincta]|uniref:Sodium-coupled monocarboxylate transporter 2 n=1 Tax=Orchesella cincta TaxID=48709 RepID=A0A1D2NLT9_ORCCI|nr:Sodium-coupled monocarboxylate transporter 2 [Orchesella cincta]
MAETIFDKDYASLFGWPEYCIFGSVVALSMGIGIFYGFFNKKNVTNEDFLVGGRSMSVFPVTLSLGGLKAVLWSDALQAIIMFGSTLTILFLGTNEVGGFNVVWERAKEGGRTEFWNFDTDPRTRYTFWTGCIGAYFTWLPLFAGTQGQIQRYLAVSSVKKAQQSLLFSLLGLICVQAPSFFLGLVIYAKYHDCDPVSVDAVGSSDQLLPLFVMDTLGNTTGLPGFMNSSVSSALNAIPAIIVEDYVKSYYPNLTEAKLGYLSKLISGVAGLISFALIFVIAGIGSIVPFSALLHGTFLGPTVGIFTLAFFFPFCNSIGSILGAAVSISLTLFLGIGSTINGINGNLPNQKLPLRTNGCYLNESDSNSLWKEINEQVSWKEEEHSGIINFFSVSYIWHPAVAVLGTVIFGLIFSTIVNVFIAPEYPVKEEYMSPLIVKMWKKVLSDEMFHRFIQEDDTNAEYVERHLELSDEEFLIIPNGGSGDCMFKAVSQAVNNGDESQHKEIRKQVVEFVINEKWEKFSESIEVQHINGNNLLQRQWSKNPKQTYKMYMNLAGTLGSSTELTAAGELYHYNFATIQEYCNSTSRTYRVENCILYEHETAFHFFYFTGDYDNGHWEYIKNLSSREIDDGTYKGSHKTLINGEDTSVEEWLGRDTPNRNDAELLKVLTDRTIYARRRSLYPFDLNCFEFDQDRKVKLAGDFFSIANTEYADLFSVLAYECLQNETSASETEIVLLKHRYSYFEDLNYKLVTQPWSHNFTIDAIKYCGYPSKGNIQDLLSAADLYSFSFILFMKLHNAEEDADEDDDEVHECKFTHVDRWGGESDRTLYFFMRLVPSEKDNSETIAKWWLLLPQNRSTTHIAVEDNKSVSKLFKTQKSKHRLRSVGSLSPKVQRSFAHFHGIPETAFQAAERMNSSSPVVLEHRGSLHNARLSGSHIPSKKPSRASTPRPQSACTSRNVLASRERDISTLQPVYEFAEAIVGARPSSRRSYRHHVSDDESLDTSNDEGMKTDDCIKKDFQKLFGSDRKALSLEPSIMAFDTPHLTRNRDKKLFKKQVERKQNVKPATGSDLLKHPEKVRTVVKVTDKKNSGREITYKGTGYIRADDVLTELGSQGLIRLPATPTSAKSSGKSIYSHDEKFSDYRQKHFGKSIPTFPTFTDENFNFVRKEEKPEDVNIDITYEPVGAGAFATDEASEWPREEPQNGFVASEFVSSEKYNQSRVRINKVSPEYAEVSQNYMNKHCKIPENEYKNENDKEESGKSCTSGFRRFFSWFLAKFRRASQRSRQGLRYRYERYKSSTLF